MEPSSNPTEWTHLSWAILGPETWGDVAIEASSLSYDTPPSALSTSKAPMPGRLATSPQAFMSHADSISSHISRSRFPTRSGTFSEPMPTAHALTIAHSTNPPRHSGISAGLSNTFMSS